jgi:hypothetical protein
MKSVRNSWSPSGEHVVDTREMQLGMQQAGLALGLGRSAVGNQLQHANDAVGAGMQRSRQVLAQDQQFGDPGRV